MGGWQRKGDPAVQGLRLTWVRSAGKSNLQARGLLHLPEWFGGLFVCLFMGTRNQTQDLKKLPSQKALTSSHLLGLVEPCGHLWAHS